MTFSKEWNTIYQKNLQINNWPFTDLISLIVNHFDTKRKNLRILELGSGSGPNIPFFLSLKMEYFGIDGSSSIIKKLKKKYPKIKNNLMACDFTSEIPFEKKFDLIIDRSSLTHNSTTDIERCLDLIEKKLNRNGKYLGLDWFSTNHFEYQNGSKSHDMFTKNNFKNGQFKKIGNVHFSNKTHILKLFQNFKIELLNEKIIKTKIPNQNNNLAFWNIVAKKK
tara:strand:- start:208 stop:873 length:666 start_codon:yes stop_codon:yes gene_type:complete